MYAMLMQRSQLNINNTIYWGNSMKYKYIYILNLYQPLEEASKVDIYFLTQPQLLKTKW